MHVFLNRMGEGRVILMLTCLVVALTSHPVEAKKKRSHTIELTGIQSFDKVFRKAMEADRKLRSAERNVRKSKNALRKALKLAKGTTYIEGLQELKQRARGKISVAMQGGVPTLKARDAVPSDIMAGITAVNTLSRSIPSSLRDMKQVTSASTAMYRQARKFPSNIRSELGSKGVDGLKAVVFKAPKIAKTTLRNLKVMSTLPKRSATVSRDLGRISNAIRKTFM